MSKSEGVAVVVLCWGYRRSKYKMPPNVKEWVTLIKKQENNALIFEDLV